MAIAMGVLLMGSACSKKESDQSGSNANSSTTATTLSSGIGASPQTVVLEKTNVKSESLLTTSEESGVNLSIGKQIFQPGEDIIVSYKSAEALPPEAWLGLMHSNTPHMNGAINDQYDQAYHYLEQATEKSFIFKAPEVAASYDIRVSEGSKEESKEMGFVSFIVSQTNEIPEASLMLEKMVFAPSEQMTLKFTAPIEAAEKGWIGIVPSGIPHGDEDLNDQHDLSYQYTNGKTTGTFLFNAPTEAGSYDLRLHTSSENGKEIAYASFEVKAD